MCLADLAALGAAGNCRKRAAIDQLQGGIQLVGEELGGGDL
jgi:hypothetical protein